MPRRRSEANTEKKLLSLIESKLRQLLAEILLPGRLRIEDVAGQLNCSPEIARHLDALGYLPRCIETSEWRDETSADKTSKYYDTAKVLQKKSDAEFLKDITKAEYLHNEGRNKKNNPGVKGTKQPPFRKDGKFAPRPPTLHK
jgi:hypothetical protein